MIYDVIIVGAGAAGLFSSIYLPKNLSKLILEKNEKPGIKVLLSGGERANVSNMDIEPTRDYFGQNKKALISIFKRFSNWDIISFFAENGIKIVEEDRGRLILESGDSSELLNLLLKKSKDNNTSLLTKSEVVEIIPPPPFNKEGNITNIYEIKLSNGSLLKTKNVIISSGGKSFSQVGTTGDGYNFANDFGIKIINPHRGLCGLVTKRDLSSISGVSTNLKLVLKDKKNPSKSIYEEFGPLLFTHFGVSGPIIFNTAVVIGEYINKIGSENEDEKILNDLYLELYFDIENTPKRVKSFFYPPIPNPFPPREKENLLDFITLDLQTYRSWKEAKVTGGGIDINELDNYMQTKKQKGLFFIGEVVDVTGKTGGFNLQWAWSSAFACSEYFKK